MTPRINVRFELFRFFFPIKHFSGSRKFGRNQCAGRLMAYNQLLRQIQDGVISHLNFSNYVRAANGFSVHSSISPEPLMTLPKTIKIISFHSIVSVLRDPRGCSLFIFISALSRKTNVAHIRPWRLDASSELMLKTPILLQKSHKDDLPQPPPLQPVTS